MTDNNTQITKTTDPTLDKFASVAQLLQSAKVQTAIARALPKHLSAERMIRVAMTAIQKTPKLAECDQRSLVSAIVQCSELGLEPNGPLGHAYLIPFFNSKTKRNEVQLIPGYRGMIALARRSGKVQGIYAELVYSKDYFEVTYGLDKNIIHKPALDEEDRGDLIGAYAVAKFSDGYTDFEYMSATEINKIRKGSKAGDSGPWVSHTGEMWRKTPIRRLFKRLPASVEDATLQRVVEIEEINTHGFGDLAPLELGTGEPPAVITEEQRIALVEAAKRSGLNLTEIVQAAGFTMLAEITVDQYDAILDAASETPEKPVPVVGDESAKEPEQPTKPKAEKPAKTEEPKPEAPAEDAQANQDPQVAVANAVLELAQIKGYGIEADVRELLGNRNEAAVRKMKLEDLQELHANLMQK